MGDWVVLIMGPLTLLAYIAAAWVLSKVIHYVVFKYTMGFIIEDKRK